MTNMSAPSMPTEPLVGYAYVPEQIAVDTNIYDAETGLMRGTIFPALDLPLGVYGKQFKQEENKYE